MVGVAKGSVPTAAAFWLPVGSEDGFVGFVVESGLGELSGDWVVAGVLVVVGD